MPNQIFALLFIFLISLYITRKPEYEFGSIKRKFGFSWGLEYTKRLCSHEPCLFFVWCHGYSCVICSLVLLILTLLILIQDLDLFCHYGFTWAPRGCSPSSHDSCQGAPLLVRTSFPPASLSPLPLAHILLHETAQPFCALAYAFWHFV